MLLAFDLDNTIVRRDYELPSLIVQTIHQVRDKGYKVVILTGRPHIASVRYLKQLKITEYYSTNHGSLVIGKAGTILQHKRIPSEKVRQIIEVCGAFPDVEYSCIVDGVLFVKNPKDERWAWAHTASRQVEPFQMELDLNADKIVFSANGLIPDIRRHIETHHPGMIMYPWENGYLEVTGPGADKGTALALLARELNIEQSDVVAFGDGPNDISMLTWAAHAVAVGPHAHSEVLSVANEHIEAPENLGVAEWLKENVLR